MKKFKYQCEECGEKFVEKKDLIEHLKQEFEEGTDQADNAVNQLNELSIKNPY